MTLLGHSEEPGDLAGHGPIDAHTARRLAAQAPSFLRILTHPETGTVLSVGRDRYAVPADLKSWLRIRDETCRFPGCSRRAQRCDIDHVKDWAHGGTTDHHNLIHLCRNHHRLKHTTAWTVSTGPPVDDHGPPGRSSTDPPSRQSTNAPDGPTSRPGSRHRAPAHDEAAFTGDVVHWTAPSGRTYIDHAARAMARRHEVELSACAAASEDGDQSQFPDEPPF
ncbi:HNH endonuclease [Sanguibacter keddieii]|uniref:HNH endonuclease n=1 Tax=Sanguibacter keddieii TaxID=60920 RepID=UPI00068A7DAA